jgi:hypothetical protein
LKLQEKYRFSLGWKSKNYDNNDLGINFETNYYTLSGNASYRIKSDKTFQFVQHKYQCVHPVSKRQGKIQEITLI